MKGKNDFFSKFKEYKSLVEKQTDRKSNILCSDNDEEFTSDEFKEICKESRIKRELSTPYNPRHIGIAEQKNQTIMKASRVVLHDQDLPMHLWVEEARTIVYV